MEFLSKYTAGLSRAFVAFLRLFTFKSGFPLNLTVDILLLAPVIGDQNHLCVVYHLTSLKFNISGKCFTGPVQHTNLLKR